MSSSSTSVPVSDQVAPVLRLIEKATRQICDRISEQGVISLVKTALLFGALFALKENLKHIFGFKCPQQGHLFYGSLYIFGPAVFFLCFAFVFSRPFWEFVTGCCRLRCNKRLLALPNAAVDIYLAISAPLLWVACGLSEEDYYMCAMYGPLGYEYMNTWYKSIAQVNEAKALCHVLVWAILILWAIISAVVVSLYRCCVRDEYETKIPTQTV